MRSHALRVIPLAALVLGAALALWGCQGTLTPSTDPGGSTNAPGAVAAVDGENYTAPGTVNSDWDAPTMMGAPFADPGADPDHMWGRGLPTFRREVTSSTRTHTFVQTGDSASVTVVEDRSGILHVRVDSATVVDRPFTDHGERRATLFHAAGDRWRVVDATFMDRASTLVTTPILIESVTFTPENGAPIIYDSASTLLPRNQWPVFPNGHPVAIAVKVTGFGPDGARVFLHDRDGRGRSQIELTQDAVDKTLFTGTWRPRTEFDTDRMWNRLITVDAFDASTLSKDTSAVYNAHQWVMPTAHRHENWEEANR